MDNKKGNITDHMIAEIEHILNKDYRTYFENVSNEKPPRDLRIIFSEKTGFKVYHGDQVLDPALLMNILPS